MAKNPMTPNAADPPLVCLMSLRFLVRVHAPCADIDSIPSRELCADSCRILAAVTPTDDGRQTGRIRFLAVSHG